MKTGFLIIIVGLVILSSVIFVAIWNAIPKECDDKCEHERRSIEAGSKLPIISESSLEQNVSTDSKTIQDIVDYCTHKIKLALGKIPSRNPDGSYNILHNIPIVFENQTHYMDNNNCQLIQTWDGHSHPFGYEYEPKVIFSINTLEE